jgi:hypothetical protein
MKISRKLLISSKGQIKDLSLRKAMRRFALKTTDSLNGFIVRSLTAEHQRTFKSEEGGETI